jgi:hypothetical protein
MVRTWRTRGPKLLSRGPIWVAEIRVRGLYLIRVAEIRARGLYFIRVRS